MSDGIHGFQLDARIHTHMVGLAQTHNTASICVLMLCTYAVVEVVCPLMVVQYCV